MMINFPNDRKGFTLVEVVISFAIVGILILMVGGAVTSTYQTATVLQKIPSVYFSGQDAVENKIESLDNMLIRKYNIEKELNSGTVSSALSAELQQIEADIVAAETGEEIEAATVTLFGKDVTVYKIKESVAKENGEIILYAGTAGGVRYERPVPVISQVKVDVVNHTSAAEYFNVVGGTASAVVTYSDINEDYKYDTMYRWYVSSGRQRAVPYNNNNAGATEDQLGALIPIFPANFELITENGASSSLQILEKYKGKFLLCVATPLSNNGKMGRDVVSNMIYISDMPVGPSYRSVIDPSLMTLDHSSADENEHILPLSLDNTSAVSASSKTPISFSTGNAYIDLNGAYIDGNKDTKTRFFHFSSETYISSPGGKSSNTDVVFVVARKNDMAPGSAYDFIKESGNIDIDENNSSSYGPNTIENYADGWYLVVLKFQKNNNNKYQIGKANVDIAELIIVGAPTASQIQQVTDYLLAKYNISADSSGSS